MAEIALDITLNVESQNKNVSIGVSRRQKQISMAIEKSTTPIDEYHGPYNVKPRFFYGHVLETKGKSMSDDVTVDSISVFEVSNPAGGRTVTIGAV